MRGNYCDTLENQLWKSRLCIGKVLFDIDGANGVVAIEDETILDYKYQQRHDYIQLWKLLKHIACIGLKKRRHFPIALRKQLAKYKDPEKRQED
ncbi:hypothetical protein Trydic_g8699 [Trypoxylus dichotomus]